MVKKERGGRANEVARSLVYEINARKETLEKQVSRLEQAFSTQTKLQKHSYLFAEMPYSIRDPIYGNVPLSKAAFRTLNVKSFQRLKRLRQTGPALHVYPGLQHSRFEHSVGVYHLMRLVLQHFALQSDVDFEPEQGRLALCTALLHDIGHFPYSHVMEEIRVDNRQLRHDELSTYIVENDSELSSILKDEWAVQATDVAAVLLHKKEGWPRFLYRLLNSTIDLDKMDYLCRDAYYAGVPYGVIDARWLISSFLVDPSDQDILIDESGIGAVEQLIFAKYLMYRNIYWHHTNRVATAMIKRAVIDFLLEFGLDSLDILGNTKIRELCLSTDADFFETMKKLAGGRTLPLSSLDLLERLNLRHLYKRVHVIYACDALEKESDYRDAKRRRRKGAEICAAISELPQWESTKLHDWDILIDVAMPANFPVDIKGVFFSDPPLSYVDQGLNIVKWNEGHYVSYFERDLLKQMEEGIRKIRYFYNPENPAGDQLRSILRAHPELY